ncbi:MAG: PD-(D/E)XK nuclease family protein [Candidatus Wallbacteria bacterium]|nr:PD-(D/E)XK nuclease family protein [Candidatus Wallbacteria bacterium]
MNDMNTVSVPGLEHLSHSRIQAYLNCGLKFRFHYIDHLRPAFVPAALAYGIAFHEAVEEALAGVMVGAMPPVSDLVGVVARSLDQQERDVPIQYADEGGKDALLELASRMLTAWTAWPRPAGRILAVEHSFEFVLAPGLPPVVGRIDLVTEEADAVVLTDIKTAKSRWSSREIDEHSSQLVLYREAVKQMAAEMGKPVRLAYEVITKTKTPVVERYVIERAPDELDRQRAVAQLVRRAVDAGIFIPQPGWACATCPWAGPCREWGRKLANDGDQATLQERPCATTVALGR